MDSVIKDHLKLYLSRPIWKIILTPRDYVLTNAYKYSGCYSSVRAEIFSPIAVINLIMIDLD